MLNMMCDAVTQVTLEKETFLKNSKQSEFLKYVRTKMVFTLRIREGKDNESTIKAVHIPSSEIEERFFPYSRKEQIQQLIDVGELKVTEQGRAFYYEALKPGGFDLSLLKIKPLPKDHVTQTMVRHLKNVSLPKDAERTFYFDLFLRHKDKRPDLFFKIDSFASRIHSPVSNLHRTMRPALLLNGEKTTSLDVVTMQPLLLGKIIFNAIGENEYSKWISSGEDIYIKLQNKAGLKNRDEAKKVFFEILFSKPSNALSNLFGAANWINWINDFKGLKLVDNPHNANKPHSNLAWLLQNTETAIMRKVWTKLVDASIPFISIHDEILTTDSYQKQAFEIMGEILSKEFQYFKINKKINVLFEPSLASQRHSTPPKEPLKAVINPEVLELQAFYSNLEATGKLVFRMIELDGTPFEIRDLIGVQWRCIMQNYYTGDVAPYVETLKLLKAYY